MLKIGLFLIASLAMYSLNAQRIKSDDVEYRYIKLPLTPLPSTIQNYQSSIFATYEAENQKLLDQYNEDLAKAEEDFQKATAEHPAKVKAAEDKFEAEMAEWNKKSMAEKVVEKQLLNENNKPVKHLPSTPYKKSVQKPVLKTSYDYNALSSTYLILDGYENNSANAVKIEVILNGFEYTKPKQVTEVKKIVSTSNGTSTSKDVNYYHVEFTYRHTMSVKVTSPEGKELFYLSPQELNTYKTYKSSQSTTSSAINEDQLVKTHEEKILQENLTFINGLVNDRIGFKRETRKTTLSYIKTKDDVYSDMLIAFNDGNSGLKSLLDDGEGAKNKLHKANQNWNTALNESDLNNKKARIDKDVTMMIYFNLLETYFALSDVEAAEKVLTSLNSMSISNSDKKQKEEYEALITDLKKRIIANKK